MPKVQANIVKKIDADNQEKLIKLLSDTGIKVLPEKKKPENGRYSGLVGNTRGKIELNV